LLDQDSYGFWEIDGLLPGVHHISFDLPKNFLFTSPVGGHFDVTLGKREVHGGLRFGIAPITATVKGTVFNDLNGNGTRNAGEGSAGAGRRLSLYHFSAAGNWLLTGSYTTGSDGLFSFTAFPPGTYRVTLSHLDGWTTTSTNDRTFTFNSLTTIENFDFGTKQIS
jgi:hypothetical protein